MSGRPNIPGRRSGLARHAREPGCHISASRGIALKISHTWLTAAPSSAVVSVLEKGGLGDGTAASHEIHT